MSISGGPYDYDLAVVGGGSAGYAAARTGAAAGLRTVVIESANPMGGLCILRGCMPSKALLWAGEVRHLASQGSTWGLAQASIGFAWEAVLARKDRLIREFAAERSQQLTDGRFQLIRAGARFIDPHTLALTTGEKVTAGHFVLATGSVVSAPPLPQLNEIGAISSDDAVDLRKLPKSVIILGGGAIAVEFAQLLTRFDVQVTMIQRSAHVLSGFDTDVVEVLEEVFRREKIRLHTGTQLTGARRDGAMKVVEFREGEQAVEAAAEEVFIAMGREPNTRSLGLEAAGVVTKWGRVTTDQHQRTSASHIFAAGDCSGPHDIVHIAVTQGEVAAHNIAHPDDLRSLDERLLVKVVFTDPQVAVVGLTEREATQQGIAYRAASHRFNDHGKSMIMEAMHGFVKLLMLPATGEIIGGTCVGPVGGELIHEIVVAMAAHMTAKDLAAVPHYHPTLAEIWTYPAEELAGLRPPSNATEATENQG